MKKVSGSNIQDVCEKEGVIALSNAGGVWAVRTRCKGWRCRTCRKTKIALLAWRIKEACSSAEEPWFVSVTYGMSQEMQGSCYETREKYKSAIVNGAVRDWREFCRRYNREYQTKIRWLRIPELTKRGMLHWHLIIDGMRIDGYGRCKTKMGARFKKDRDCDCHTHQVSRIWEGVTGWYVVDVRPVTNDAGIGNYLSGYLTKMSDEDYEYLTENGIIRRVETSRGFATLPKITRPAGIIGYDRITIHPRKALDYLRMLTDHDPAFKAVGNVFGEEQKKKAYMRKVRFDNTDG